MVVAADRVAEDFPLIGEASVPGRHINDHQKRLFMKHRQNDGAAVAAAKAGLSTATGYRLEKARSAPPPPRSPRGRRRPDPLADIFEAEVVPILKTAPGLRAVAVFEELRRRHKEDLAPASAAPSSAASAPGARSTGRTRR